jgi:hypothetical protein
MWPNKDKEQNTNAGRSIRTRTERKGTHMITRTSWISHISGRYQKEVKALAGN